MVRIFIYIVLMALVFGCGDANNNTISVVKKPKALSDKEQLLELNKQFAKAEGRFMQYYIDSLNISATHAPLGYWYWVYSESGNQRKPKFGERVRLKYTVELLEGGRLYSSEENGLKSFVVDMGEVESGLHHAVKHLNLGDKSKIIIPSHLAFGTYGDGNKIPSKATLLYDIELVEITTP